MNKFIVRRYLLFIVSVFINAFGIAFITKALLGTSPITSVTYVLSMFTTYTMGQWTILLNLLFVLIDLLLMKPSEIKADLRMFLLQIPITLCFGVFIDVSMNTLEWLVVTNYLSQLVTLVVGCFILAVGIGMEVKADIAMVAGEYLVRALSKCLHKEFGFVKLGLDITLVLLSCLLSLIFMSGLYGVREGTVVAALVVGPIVHFLKPYYRIFDSWIGLDQPTESVIAFSASADRHIVITIAREYGSGGHLLGELLAVRLGIPFYDKELILLAAQESGLSQQYVQQNEQTMSPVWLKNLILQNYESSLNFSLSSRDALFVAQGRVIRKIAAHESYVLIGRCADYILKNDPNVIKVFCYSDIQSELTRCVDEYGLCPEQAETEIKRINHSRITHYEYYTGQKWGDPHNYDLMINTGSLNLQTACDLIAGVYEEKKYRVELADTK